MDNSIHAPRAAELAVAQKKRFDVFKVHFKLTDTNTDVIREFLKDDQEAHYAFLIMYYLNSAVENGQIVPTTID